MMRLVVTLRCSSIVVLDHSAQELYKLAGVIGTRNGDPSVIRWDEKEPQVAPFEFRRGQYDEMSRAINLINRKCWVLLVGVVS